MKKGNILIAVMAILAAASVAKAQGIEINFDGKRGIGAQSRASISDVGIIEGIRMVPVPGAADNRVSKVASRFPAQNVLKKIVREYLASHRDLSGYMLLSDARTVVMYDDSGVYLVNKDMLVVITDRELLGKLRASAGGGMKLTWADAAFTTVVGCLFNTECRDGVVNHIEGAADYYNNLPDDESTTYHNNQDGSNSNYEVYKKVE